jgi:hypothetical protein
VDVELFFALNASPLAQPIERKPALFAPHRETGRILVVRPCRRRFAYVGSARGNIRFIGIFRVVCLWRASLAYIGSAIEPAVFAICAVVCRDKPESKPAFRAAVVHLDRPANQTIGFTLGLTKRVLVAISDCDLGNVCQEYEQSDGENQSPLPFRQICKDIIYVGILCDQKMDSQTTPQKDGHI